VQRLKLTLAYEGTSYAGWQTQTRMNEESPPAAFSPPTIQGVLESRMAELLGRRFPLHGAGRTDAGVHAEGQVCHVDLPCSAHRIDWRQALNSGLPPDIRVLRAEWVSLSFHARKSARAKRYAYSIWAHRQKALPRIRAFVWSTSPLDPALLLPAIPLLQGRRDFASFRNSGTRMDDTVRTLGRISCLPGRVASLTCPADWPVFTLVFEGDGFLKQMVRNLAGLLAWIGQGKIPASDIPGFLAAGDRRALPSPSAPAGGLSLLEVLY
jgi:tRNA pseudouridine38-40 synthase